MSPVISKAYYYRLDVYCSPDNQTWAEIKSINFNHAETLTIYSILSKETPKNPIDSQQESGESQIFTNYSKDSKSPSLPENPKFYQDPGIAR